MTNGKKAAVEPHDPENKCRYVLTIPDRDKVGNFIREHPLDLVATELVKIDEGVKQQSEAALPRRPSSLNWRPSMQPIRNRSMARSRVRTLAIARGGDGMLEALLAAGLLVIAAFLLFAQPARADAPATPKVIVSHGISSFGDLKYPADFKHFDFVNPDAPKGGTMSFRGTGGSQTFDSLNAFILKGEPAQGLGLLYDTLLAGSPTSPTPPTA